MTTLFISHPASLDHETPHGHPERADRIRVVERVLEQERFADLVRESAPVADLETICLAHPEIYVSQLRDASPEEGMIHIDDDTAMSPGTFEAALRSAGGAIRAVTEVMAGHADNAFVGTRPPGHHAERTRAMGFCFFNNAAIAARYARKTFGADRIAIFDWDVHHGNGTQDILWRDEHIMYLSTHEMPLFPFTGDAGETGDHDTIVNVPLAAGDGSDTFHTLVDQGIVPRIEAFRPDLIILSAGFDAHWRDPLSDINLTEADFAWVTNRMIDVAGRCCDHRIVSLLEGGYDLEGLSRSVSKHVGALMGIER